MKKNHVSRVPAFLMILLAGFLSFGSLRAEGSKADLASAAEAQQRTVTGKVVDAQGQPVAGASVMIPGTNRGAVTATDGSFSIAVAEGAQLEVSFLGYETVTVAARNGTMRGSPYSGNAAVHIVPGHTDAIEKYAWSRRLRTSRPRSPSPDT